MNTQTNYNKLIPEKVLFPLSEVQDIGILKISTAKKMIDKGLLEIVRIGNKIHISRTELIRYLEDNTTQKTAWEHLQINTLIQFTKQKHTEELR